MEDLSNSKHYLTYKYVFTHGRLHSATEENLHKTFSIAWPAQHILSDRKADEHQIEYQHVFSEHNWIILEINEKKSTRKFLSDWKLSNSIMNNPWVKRSITTDIRKHFELNADKNMTY